MGKKTTETTNDLEQRQKDFIRDMELLEARYSLKAHVKMIYTEVGIVPRFVLVDQKEQDAEETTGKD